jgi:hypothetical protein
MTLLIKILSKMKLIDVENKFGKVYYNKIINSIYFKKIMDVSELDITMAINEVLKEEIRNDDK